MKKILMLGGARAQVPAIKRAKELGYYVITCDYLPDNPGHKFSDEYKNISTVEKEQVLQFAKERGIDGVIAYASDPSAITAAYVADHLGLPGSSYEAVKMMCEKDLFRKFQRKNGFRTPFFFSLSSLGELREVEKEIEFPCIVKPVDSSGSRGVSKVENGIGGGMDWRKHLYRHPVFRGVEELLLKVIYLLHIFNSMVTELYMMENYSFLHWEIRDSVIPFLLAPRFRRC